MPNGGMDNCAHCSHFDEANSFCRIRRVEIESSYWTTCRNFDLSWGDASRKRSASNEIDGPLFAIICEVVGGGGRYGRLPYLDGCRPDTCVPETRPYGYCKGDTIVYFVDAQGNRHEFDSAADYMAFWEAN